MFENSDEYDFNPSGSSKLASLFEDIPDNLHNANSSLTYTAPKQPRARKEVDLNESTKSKSQTSVLLAKVVSLWKLEDKNYKSLGKHGLAVIGSSDLNLFEIIAYKEKNNILLRRKINDTCTVYNQKESFSSFYDDENQNWLAKFDNYDNQNVFCQLIQNYNAKVINTVDESSRKKDEVLLIKKSSDVVKDTTTKDETVSDVVDTPDKDGDINSDSSGSQKRATILSRMAKMGQQILPSSLLKNTSPDVSDSEFDDSQNDRKTVPRKFRRTIHVEKTVIAKEQKLPPQTPQESYIENQMVPSQNNNFSYAVQQFPQNITAPVLYSQPVPYDGFNNFIVAQNTELKMNLAQISAKLDSVLGQNNTSSIKTEDRALKSKVKALELKCENLQQELEKYEIKHNSLEKMYKNLEGKSKDNTESARNKVIIQQLNEELGKLRLDMKIAEEKIVDQEQLHSEYEKCKNNIKDCEKIIEIQKLKLKDFEEFYEENKNNKNLQTTIDSLNETVSNLKLKLSDFEEYYNKAEAKKQKHNESNDKILSAFSDKIKEHMNQMYQSILANFDEGSSYSVANINLVVAQNLKGTTFKIIEDMKNSYKNDGIE